MRCTKLPRPWKRRLAMPIAQTSHGNRRFWSRLTKANAATLLKMIDTLEEDDDVQTVWGNYDVSDEVMAKLG